MSDNPRQFSSLDNGDLGMGESLTNRPATGAPASEPIDLAQHFAVEKRVADIQKQNGTYTPRTSEAEVAYQAELKAASDAAFRETVQKARDAQEIQAQREQAQRAELLKIRSEAGAPHPYETESERNTARRLMGLPPVDDPPATSAATASRQPLPSTGSPPPTLNGTAARANALVEPTATPAPAALKEAIGGAVGGIGQTLPKSLLQAAGRLVVPGVGAGLTFAGALIAGQSVQQAATTAVAVTAGGYVGGLIGTAVAVPIGFYVGSMIGGFVGGQLANALFPQNLPSGTAHIESFTPNYPPFLGGQTEGAAYRISVTYDMVLNGEIIGTFTDGPALLYGPISGPRVVYNSPNDYGIAFDGKDFDGTTPKTIKFYRGGPAGSRAQNPRNIQAVYQNGDPSSDPGGNIIQPAPPPDNTPYNFGISPIGNDNTIPSGKPAAGLNKGASKYVPPSMPSNNTPNGAPFFPGHGGLAPSYLPNPTQIPSNGGGMLPQLQPLPQKELLPFADPKDIPSPRSSGNGSVQTNADGSIRLYGPSTATPTPTPDVVKPIPIGDAISPVPKANAHPIPKTPEQVATDKTNQTIEQQKKDFDDQIKRLTAIATGLAALTPAIRIRQRFSSANYEVGYGSITRISLVSANF